MLSSNLPTYSTRNAPPARTRSSQTPAPIEGMDRLSVGVRPFCSRSSSRPTNRRTAIGKARTSSRADPTHTSGFGIIAIYMYLYVCVGRPRTYVLCLLCVT